MPTGCIQDLSRSSVDPKAKRTPGRSSVSRWQTRREERQAAKWQLQNVVVGAGLMLHAAIRLVVVEPIVSVVIGGARIVRS